MSADSPARHWDKQILKNTPLQLLAPDILASTKSEILFSTLLVVLKGLFLVWGIHSENLSLLKYVGFYVIVLYTYIFTEIKLWLLMLPFLVRCPKM